MSILLISQNTQAQVTIGKATPPQDFSTLEIASDLPGGLRLPRISTADRDSKLMSMPGFVAEKGTNGLATGLTIYNIDTRCIEYWDSNKWVSLCLGTANITLDNSCGLPVTGSNPVAMADADGTSLGCIYTPSDNPPCNVSSGQAYQVYLTVGDRYTTLNVDNITSSFSVDFTPNNSNTVRSAIVRIVNNCSGEYQDFIFQQAGAICPSPKNPTLNVTSASICNSGRVYANIVNPEKDVDYIWTYGSVVINTGTYIEADRPGIYRVYTGLVGCGVPATFTVTAGGSGYVQPATTISATNSGVLCNNGAVILTTSNTNGNSVQWFHNGAPYKTATKDPLSISGADMAGEWFAAVVNGGCYSASINKLQITSQTSGSTMEIPKALINGQDITGTGVVVCQNGSLYLSINNKDKFPAGTTFEWFVNSTSLGASGQTELLYMVPSTISSMIISVQASFADGSCPAVAISKNIPVTLTASPVTSINNGATNAYICGIIDAQLVANYSGGKAYEWFQNGKFVAATGDSKNSYLTKETGSYTVRYKDASGCWSKLSSAIAVVNSNSVDMQWGMAPKDTEIINSIRNYSIVTAPKADRYVWTAPGATSIVPLNDGSTAVIQFPSTEATITVTAEAINGCGTTTLSKEVSIVSGCNPVSAVNIAPAGAILYEGGSQIFTAYALNADGQSTYEWTLDGIKVGTNSKTFTYSSAEASETPHILEVKVTGCNNSVAQSLANIMVNPDYNAMTPDATGNYNFSGQVCFDVNMTSSQACGDIISRTNSFESKLTFDYIFNASNKAPYTDLSFYTDDPSMLLASVQKINALYKVTFRNDIRTFIRDNGSKSVAIIATFKDGAGSKRKVTIVLNIQDCACCGVKMTKEVASFKRFMCHNLGANESLDPFTPSQDIMGSYYQWGAKEPAASAYTPVDGNNTIAGWNTKWIPDKANWLAYKRGSQDPCPQGFRVPTQFELGSIFDNNKIVPIGVTWTSSATNFSSGYMIGDRLFLPAAGDIQPSGRLNLRGTEAKYSTGDYSGTNGSYTMTLYSKGSINTISVTSANINAASGMPVRCIENYNNGF